MPKGMTQEEVFADDKDPLDAIRELRQEEGVAEEDLPPASEESSESSQAAEESQEDDDLKAFDENSEAGAEDDGSSESQDEQSQQSDEGEKGEGDDLSMQEEGDGAEEGDGTEKAEEEKPVELLKFKANGQEFEFTPEEVVAQFETVFGQAMDYTKKMQQIAPYRKMISALEQEGISQDQLNIAIDALKGDKGALQKLLQVHEIDAMDLDSDESSPYTPTEYGKAEDQLAIEEVAARISGDPEYKITVDVIDNQWDQSSRDTFASNPGLIQGLHNDIKSGVYDQVAPVAMKMKVLDGNSKSDIEYYMLAGQQLQQAQQQNASQQKVDELNGQTQAAVQNADQASSEAQRKRAATSTGARADRKTVVDYLDDDDEKFDEWYKKLQASN